MISSKYTKHVCQCSPRSTCSISLSNVARALTSPKGIKLYSYSPVVANAVFSRSWGSTSTCQYPLIKLRVENHAEPLRASSESSILGSGYEFLIVTLFKCLKSVHTLILPSFLQPRTTGAAQGLFDGMIIPWSNILLISFSHSSLFDFGIRPGLILIGLCFSISMACRTTFVWPKSSLFLANLSLFLSSIFSALGFWFSFSFVWDRVHRSSR